MYSRHERCLVKSALGFILIFALCVATGVGFTVLFATGGLTRWMKLAQPPAAIVRVVTDNLDVYVAAENGKTYACVNLTPSLFSWIVEADAGPCRVAAIQVKVPTNRRSTVLPCNRLTIEFLPTTSPPLLARECAMTLERTLGGVWRTVYAVDVFGGLWRWRRSIEAVDVVLVFSGLMLICVPGGVWLGTAWVRRRKGRERNIAEGR